MREIYTTPSRAEQGYRRNEQWELPKEVDAVYILFNGSPHDEKLSFDARVRALAAVEILKYCKEHSNGGNENDDTIKTKAMPSVYLVGGGADKPEESGSHRMKDYIVRHGGDDESIIVLGQSNNTAGNIEEILEHMNKNEHTKALIVSNDYHGSRIKQLLSYYGVSAGVVAAEDCVKGRSSHHEKLLKEYEMSPEYKKKKFIDSVMTLYLRLDPKQKLVDKVRSFTRKHGR